MFVRWFRVVCENDDNNNSQTESDDKLPLDCATRCCAQQVAERLDVAWEILYIIWLKLITVCSSSRSFLKRVFFSGKKPLSLLSFGCLKNCCPSLA